MLFRSDEIYRRPNRTSVAAFVGASNRIDGRFARSGAAVECDALGLLALPEPADATDGAPAILMTRPESVTLAAAADNAPSATVVDRVLVGASDEYTLELKGDEKVLDAGCGRGLMAIGIAKKLSKTGKVTAIDIWDTTALSGNLGDAARDNAKAEGVADRVRIENGDMRKLPYPAGNFDLVVCTWAIHHMEDEPDRDQAVRELFRVTKPGGRVVIADTNRSEEHTSELQSH